MNVAVIPARAGSKRIPDKNIRDFCGKPMIGWSIEAALASGCFARVVVSTDSEVIARTARSFGAEVPFLRPAELADDFVGTTPVVQHAVRTLQATGAAFERVCCIYATAPFLTAKTICDGLDRHMETGADYVFSVTSYAFPIQRAIRLNPAGRAEMFDPEKFTIRSQDLEPAWHDAGQFYWGTTAAWLDGRVIFSAASAPLELPRHRVQDIDTPDDWIRAELMFRALNPTP